MARNLTDFSIDMFSLKGKVAMVTGANQGLGMAYAVALANVGADLFIPHYTPDVSEVKGMIEGAGRKVAFLQGDLTDETYRKEVVQSCLDTYGKIDILINNAGNNYVAPLLEVPDEKYRMVLDLQLNAVYYLSCAVAKTMVPNGGGKIINIASELAYASDINSSSYTVAKHGIVGLTRSLTAELGKFNISCNAIAPGFYISEVNAEVRKANPDAERTVGEKIPLGNGHWGDVYDLMGLAVFLASPASDYISGEIICVDGGYKACM